MNSSQIPVAQHNIHLFSVLIIIQFEPVCGMHVHSVGHLPISLRHPGFSIWGLPTPPGLQSLLVFSIQLMNREGCTWKMFMHQFPKCAHHCCPVLLVTSLLCCSSNYKDPGNVITMCQGGGEVEYWQALAALTLRPK